MQKALNQTMEELLLANKTAPEQSGNTCDQYVLARHVTRDGERVFLAINFSSLSL